MFSFGRSSVWCLICATANKVVREKVTHARARGNRTQITWNGIPARVLLEWCVRVSACAVSQYIRMEGGGLCGLTGP